MGRDIFEDVVARHLQLKPGVFVRASHDPGSSGWVAEIDVLAVDLKGQAIIVAEVKSGGIGKFANRVAQYDNEIEARLRSQLAVYSDHISKWPIEYRLYVKSSYHEAAERRVAGSQWQVLNLDDAFQELLGN